MFRFAGFVLDPDRGELRGPDGLALRLRPKAFELLKFLVANDHRVVRKQELMEAVWPGIYVGEDSLFQCIREIRTALGDTQRRMIKVVSGRGYLFAVDVTVGTEKPDSNSIASQEHTSESSAAADPSRSRRRFRTGRISVFAALGILCVVIAALALAIVFPKLGNAPKSSQSVIQILPIVTTITDPQSTTLAQGVAAELIGGLAKIGSIRLLAPEKQDALAAPEPAGDQQSNADFVLQGELQGNSQSQIFRTRLTNVATREIETVAEVTLDANEPDKQLLASRFAAGVGYALAIRLNKPETDSISQTDAGSIAIQQATASINQTSQERFATARSILEKNLAAEPDNVDLQIALATLHLRGIQMAWYGPTESKAAESDAQSLLEHALRSKPNSITVLGAYCRLLTLTNHFTESLVVCARALSLNPWDGTALFHLGLTQLQLGRFEDALATFEQADRFDTPEVSRWTWLLGAGWADMLVGRDDNAVRWLQRSIAITPASGRVYMLLAVAYQRLGRSDDAKQALAKGMELRPGSTAANISLPSRNASPRFLEERRKITQTLIELGLPVDDATQKPTDRDQ